MGSIPMRPFPLVPELEKGSGFGPDACRFESCRAGSALVAQLAAHQASNLGCPGSTPGGRIRTWPSQDRRRPVSDRRFAGSNPAVRARVHGLVWLRASGS